MVKVDSSSGKQNQNKGTSVPVRSVFGDGRSDVRSDSSFGRGDGCRKWYVQYARKKVTMVVAR